MEGPQFSSLAESLGYKAMGHDVIGMTAMPEAKLAREAELAYAIVAMVTDFDCWHPDHADVDVASIIAVIQANADKAARLLARLLRDFPAEHEPCPAGFGPGARQRADHRAGGSRSQRSSASCRRS